MFIKPAFIASAFFLALSVGVVGTAWAAPPSDRSCGSEPLSIDCGGAKATIECVPGACTKLRDGPACAQTTLRLKRADGRVVNLAKPKGLKAHYYSAVGLACNRAKDGRPYLVVNYGAPPLGCVVCEWWHLYTTKGRLLTSSDPPVIDEDPLHKDDQPHDYPNNKEFNTLEKKLDLKGPDVQFFH